MFSLNTPIQKATIASLGALLVMLCLSGTIYILVSNFAQADALAQFGQQLSILSLVVAFSAFLGMYYYERCQYAQTQSSCPKNTTDTLQALIVDDNESNCLVINNLLQTKEVSTHIAYNGKDAVTMFRRKSPDLIFMDIEMDGMNGIEATKAIRLLEKPHERTPIIAVSAHDSPEKRYQALLAGFDDYLIKPLKDAHLYESLRRWSHTETPNKTTESAPSTTPENIIDINTTTQIEDDTSQTSNALDNDTINKTVNIEKSLAYSNQNKSLAKDMLSLLIKMIKDEKKHMAQSHQEQDWEKLAQLTHKLYGGSCYCGVEKLQVVCKTADLLLQQVLQQENQQEQQEKIDTAMDKLFIAMEEILAWDEQYDVDVIFE